MSLKVKLFLSLFLFSITSLHSFAESSKKFTYLGQATENIKLSFKKMVTLYRDELQDSTCYRDEAYTVNECGNVTYYRTQCRDVPGYNDCRDVYDRVCNYETRYRRVCTRGPSQRVCRTVPGRRVCRTTPGRQVCRTNSRGERNCRHVPGREVCENGPGRQVCENQPGREVCRQVPYQDRVCRNVTRRQCDWVPSRRVCEEIPYQVYECKDVVRYRKVPYACKVTVKVPYEEEKEFTNNLTINFEDESNVGDAEFLVSYLKTGRIVTKVVSQDKNNIITHSAYRPSGEEYSYETSVDVMFFDKNIVSGPTKAESKSAWINKLGQFSVVFDKEITNTRSRIEFIVKKKDGSTHFKKTLSISDFSITARDDGKVKMRINLAEFGFARIRGTFGTGVKLKVSIEVSSKIKGKPFEANEIETSKKHVYNLKAYKNS